MSESQLQVVPIKEENQRSDQGKDTIEQQDKKIETNSQQNRQSQEDEEDEQPDYSINKMLPKQNQKEKLIEQNIKLKTQIYELASQLDEILVKDKINRQKKYGVGLEEEDEKIKEKKLGLKKQELEIMDVKNKIFVLKRELDSVFNNQIIQEKENHLTHIKQKLKILEDEKEGLIKIKKGQSKALKTIKNETQYREKIEKTHKEVQRVKEETKVIMDKALEAQKNEINCHDVYVMKKKKARELEQKLALNKEKGAAKQKMKTKKQSNQMAISNEIIQELQMEVKKLEKERKKGQKVWQQKIRQVDVQLMLRKQEQQRKLLIIRQKQKELKLNEIRIKQLKKLMKQNIMAENQKKHEDVDMKKYRYQRNIKQMDK